MKPIGNDGSIAELRGYFEDIKSMRRAPKTEKADFPKEGSPYKPIFLSMIIVGVRMDDPRFSKGTIYYKECVPLIKKLYSMLDICFDLGDKDNPSIVQAFWYLGSGSPKILKLVPSMGQQSALAERIKSQKQIKSESYLLKITQCALISPKLFPFLKDELWNDALLNFLLSVHFPNDKGSLTISNIKKKSMAIFEC